MIEIKINEKDVAVKEGSTIMEAAEEHGVFIPHFCYHKKLSIAANCRMCLVEVEKSRKPLPACATPVTQGMKGPAGATGGASMAVQLFRSDLDQWWPVSFQASSSSWLPVL